MDPSDVIRNKLRDCVILDKAEVNRLADRWKTHKDYDAREQLICSVLPWAVRLVDCYHAVSNPGVSWEDLMSPAMEGLIVGVDHFDPSRGALTTCVSVWVRQKMLDYLASNSSAIRIPRYVAGELGGFIARGEPFRGIDDEKVLCAIKAKWGVGSMNHELDDDGDSLSVWLYAHNKGMKEIKEKEQNQDDEENIKRLWNAIGELPIRLRTIVELRLEGQTLHQIGDSMGITKERVRQLNEMAKGMIKESIEGSVLQKVV